jgi:hypothetical protein
MDVSYEPKLKEGAGYVHFSHSGGPTEAILFLHGHGEAANNDDGKQQGPIRLLHHPLPAYFRAPSELANVDGWLRGKPGCDVPSENVCQKWQQHYELFAPQKKQAGPWTQKKLEEVRDEVLLPLLPQRPKWHLAGTSFGGAGALQLVELRDAKIEFLSLDSLARSGVMRGNLPGNLPPCGAATAPKTGCGSVFV